MDKKLKVVHVLKSSVYSGAENVVLTIIKKLNNEFDFVYIASEGKIRAQLEQSGVAFSLLEHFDRLHLSKVLKELNPDIVHAHDFSATVLCTLIPGSFQLISHLHYDPPWSRKWNWKTWLYTVASYKVRLILAVSEKSYKNMVFAKRLQEKHVVVGNPINVENIKSLGAENVSGCMYDLIFVGRLVEQKNPQRFIELVKKLRDKEIYVKCAMLGQGELKEECLHMLQVYDLEAQIDMIGFQENPYAFMSAAKILCVTSRWEGYGLVVLEANILGVPVLSSHTAGTEEILGESACELCDSDEGFLDKIIMLLQNGKEYEHWQKKAEQRIQHMVGIDDYMRSINNIYKKVL